MCLVKQLKTERHHGPDRCRAGSRRFEAIYAVDINTVRGSIGRIPQDGHEYIVDRMSLDFHPRLVGEDDDDDARQR